MRATIAQSYGGTAVIQSESFGDDAGGGGTATWTASGTANCRLASINGGEREMGNRIAEDATWIITLPATTSVTTNSRIIVTGSGHNGTYEVLAVRAWTPSISKRLECREVV